MSDITHTNPPHDSHRQDPSSQTSAKPRLHHFALDPFCRRVRLALGEYGVVHELVEERPWLREERLLALNPGGEVPVLVEPDGTVAAGIYAVTEHLEESRARDSGAGAVSLLGETAAQRAETRRLTSFFDGRFYMDVSGVVLAEKGLKRLLPRNLGGGAPDTTALRTATARLADYLALIGQLSEQRGLLAGPRLTLADLAAAAHLSVLDYLDALKFDGQDAAKIWYQRIKSRPSFRALLGDRIAGLTPPAIYAELDF